jgi:integrase
MAVVPRPRKLGTIFYVATHWHGKVYWEPAGKERREADRLDARRKREVKAGTYQPPAGRAANTTVALRIDRWLEGRTNRSVANEAYVLGLVQAVSWFAEMPLDEVRPRHVIELVKELQATKAGKTVTNASSALSVMFRDAVIEEVISVSPVVLPKGLLKRRSKPTEPYLATEVAALLGGTLLHQTLAALAFYTGMRPGEIAGRRWHDWDETPRPLGALHVHSQYDDQPLKGDDGDTARPRLLPVHPRLASVLTEWRSEGYPLVYGQAATPDGFIIPSRRAHLSPYTRGGLYKLWQQACELVGVDGRELRATRNTFVTFARRSSPRTDIIESFTHNAAGAMIDRYNRFQWAPRCDVMGTLDFDERFDEVTPEASFLAPTQGLEPWTRRLTAACSTN